MDNIMTFDNEDFEHAFKDLVKSAEKETTPERKLAAYRAGVAALCGLVKTSL